jgi:hypothetical protein
VRDLSLKNIIQISENLIRLNQNNIQIWFLLYEHYIKFCCENKFSHKYITEKLMKFPIFILQNINDEYLLKLNKFFFNIHLTKFIEISLTGNIEDASINITPKENKFEYNNHDSNKQNDKQEIDDTTFDLNFEVKKIIKKFKNKEIIIENNSFTKHPNFTMINIFDEIINNSIKINNKYKFVNSFNYSSLIYIYYKFPNKFKSFELNDLLNNYSLDAKEKLINNNNETKLILIKEILKIIDFQLVLKINTFLRDEIFLNEPILIKKLFYLLEKDFFLLKKKDTKENINNNINIDNNLIIQIKERLYFLRDLVYKMKMDDNIINNIELKINEINLI